MKVVILCGGFGTRLREETEVRPKPMVEIGGRPILWHIMKTYAHYGYNDFVLCLGYKGEMIKNYFLNYEYLDNDFTIHLGSHQVHYHSRHHDETEWKVTLVDTGLSTSTGGRVKRIERFIDTSDFLATYGDGVSDMDIRKLVAFHLELGKIATLTGVRPAGRFGHLALRGNVVVGFREKPRNTNAWINGGFFVFNRRIFDYLDDETPLETRPMEQLAREGQLAVYRHYGYWRCMDTYRDMVDLNEEWKSRPGWKVWQ